ncbi:hypothetical protein HHK36_027744 [Tetracentron sinense]|uniref:Glutathione S-transferase n=1 Tax=Tetracentron sinense TaxID=13715 RepID=A0A835D1T9_TETSI|nr:hypothetical protein HHK36_027744 [Tetracentron sinense]
MPGQIPNMICSSIFLRVNGIDFEEITVNLAKRQQLSPEFKEINPMGQVPAIVDGRFKLFESHAILIYLACAFPGVADHWYPADLSKRAKIHSVLDWHHSNLRRGAATFVLNTVLAPALGLRLNPQAAAEAEKLLTSSLSKIESIWLKGNGKFLLGSLQPSIADLSLVCEIMQLEVLDEKDRDRILGSHKKVQQWIESTKNADVILISKKNRKISTYLLRNELEEIMVKGFQARVDDGRRILEERTKTRGRERETDRKSRGFMVLLRSRLHLPKKHNSFSPLSFPTKKYSYAITSLLLSIAFQIIFCKEFKSYLKIKIHLSSHCDFFVSKLCKTLNMAADVSSLVRILNGYKEEQMRNESTNGKSKVLITRDLLGGCSKFRSKALDLDLQVPNGWEKRLDMRVQGGFWFL